MLPKGCRAELPSLAEKESRSIRSPHSMIPHGKPRRGFSGRGTGDSRSRRSTKMREPWSRGPPARAPAERLQVRPADPASPSRWAMSISFGTKMRIARERWLIAFFVTGPSWANVR